VSESSLKSRIDYFKLAIYPEDSKFMFANRRHIDVIGAGMVLTALIGLSLAGLFRAESTFAAINIAKGVVSNPSTGKSVDQSITESSTRDRREEMRRAYGRLPMNFEVNQGQANTEVRFIARGRGYQVFLTDTEAVLALQIAAKTSECGLRIAGCNKRSNAQSAIRNPQSKLLRFKLQNARSGSGVNGIDPLQTRSNYLIGNDPENWRTDIPNYSRVEYVDVYPGVNLAYYGTQQTLEYDFIVKPGADPGQITMGIEGAEKIELGQNGDIVLHVAGEKVLHRSPIVYQQIGGARQHVTSRYVLKGGNQIGFEVENYDATRSLVIDPIIDYSTFFGGIGSDESFAIAIDNQGNAYVTGSTYSNNFNTFAPLQTTNRGGKYDAFVTKINASGSGIIYSTYVGGSGEDSGHGVAVDVLGNAYVAGITNSQDFNTRNAFQPTITGPAEDAFITKISPTGTTLIFSTYLGGANSDQAFAITLDLNSNIYIAGSTSSLNFKTKNPLQAIYRGGTDVFISKIKSDGSDLLYSTYLGGSSFDEAYGISVDSGGNAYVAGSTSSNDFNTLNPIQSNNRGDLDAFVAKIDPLGSALVFSTYLGGSAVDVAYDIAVDVTFNVYLTGHTFSTDFNVANPLQPNNRGNADAFITRINATGTALDFSTYLGGSGGDFARGIAVDPNGNAYIVGRTISTDFNIKSPLQALNRGDFDAFVTKVNPSGSDLVYSTYLGGTSDDQGVGIAADNFGNVYVTGDTRSPDFNTVNPLQAANRGGTDAFVSKINSFGSALTYSTYLGGSGEDLGLSIAIDTAGNAYITGYTSSNDFITQSPVQPVSRGGLEVFVTKILADASDIAFNTYFGGNGSDTGNGITVDGSGNCYITGATTSTNLPTRTPVQGNNRGGLDAFVAKFNATGSNIIYSTYLGGSFGDLARGIAVDTSGNVTVAGSTFSTDFTTQSPFQSNNRGNGDAFVARLNAAGTTLLYSSYLGGANTDEGAGVAVDSGGNAYVVGNTASTDFNTVNPLQPNNRGQQDVFVSKVNQNGSGLVYSTYLGGLRSDVGNGIAVDASGNAYLTGSTSSNDFNTQSPFQPTYGGGDLDAFVTKINSAGSALIYSSYLGGSQVEVGNAVAVDPFGSCYVAGITASADFPVKNPLQTDSRGGNEGFITKVNPQGSATDYSTYLGGSNDDRGYGIAVDGLGTAYVSGATSSADFNIQFPLLAYGGGTDVFVAKIISEGGFALSPGTLELQPGGNGTLTVSISTSQATDTVVTLALSNTGFVSVPPSVTIPAGATSAVFIATGVAVGGPVTITATLPPSQGGATATATVNVVASGRTIQGALVRVAAGGLLTLPIDLISQGNENRLQFSISVDNTLIFNPQFTLGGDATNANLNIVTSQASQGRYGISIQLPTGQRFTAGTRQVLVMSAVVISGVTMASTPVNFIDQPTVRRVTDTGGQSLNTSYSPGVVTIAQGYEGDVAPRPNGSNGTVTVADWSQTGRFAAGFDTVSAGAEFQRADTAPRSSLGNGSITVSDWVQTGRYAAGLDPVVPSGGPVAPAGTLIAGLGSLPELLSADLQNLSFKDPADYLIFQSTTLQTRTVRVVNATGQRGQQVNVTVECDALGSENAFGFSLNFDAAQMSFVDAALGPDAAGALLNVNNLQAAQGRAGIALAFPAGQSLTAGTKKIITLTFTIAANGSANLIPISFGDQPIVREVVNANAEVVTATWTAGAVNLGRLVANVSAASFLGNELASESIIAAFGTGLATAVQAAASLPLPTVLAGTQANVRDSLGAEHLAPLFFVAPTQVNYQLPQGTALGTATVTVTSGDGTISTGVINVTTVAPAFFSANADGQGVVAAILFRVKTDGSTFFEPINRFDSTINRFVSIPIDLGPDGEQVFLIAFGTGLRGRSGLAAVNVKIGGADAETLYLGPQGDFVGLDQSNIRIPRSLVGRGDVDVVMTVDGKPANTVKINVK
jgi:uncharacterized protein (TIGR03437 family)